MTSCNLVNLILACDINLVQTSAAMKTVHERAATVYRPMLFKFLGSKDIH